jgi:predicted PurR-regulated permease PerM
MRPDVKFPFYAKASLVFIGLIAFISVLYIGQTIIIPLVYSTIIAIVMSPAVAYLTRKKFNRTIAIFLVLFSTMLLVILIVTLLSRQLMDFGDSFPVLIEKLNVIMKQTVSWASDNFNISTRKINLWIVEKRTEMIASGDSSLGQTILNTGNVLVVLILIPVYVFMILYYQPLLLEFIRRLFKFTQLSEVNSVLTAIKKIVQSYLAGLLLEALIVAILNAVSLLILGIDYAILLGVIGAILNIIPYIGGLIAVALPMMLALATKESNSYCLLVLASYFIIQLIDNNYIIPKVVASKVRINALASIIVVLAGGALWGFAGMFLSIPLIAIVKVIFDNIESLKPWGFLLGDTMPVFPGIKHYIKVIHKKVV